MNSRLLSKWIIGSLALLALIWILLVFPSKNSQPIAKEEVSEPTAAPPSDLPQPDVVRPPKKAPIAGGEPLAPLREGKGTTLQLPTKRDGIAPFLTAPAKGDPLDIVLDHIRKPANAGRYTEEDFGDPKLTNRYQSKHNGLTHIYLRQRHEGIEVYNGNLNANVLPDGRIVSLHNSFIPDLASEVNRSEPVISARRAIAQAAEYYKLNPSGSFEPMQVADPNVAAREQRFSPGGISLSPIPVKLNYVALKGGVTKLAWNMSIQFTDTVRWFDLNVDAETGALLSEVNWVNGANYNVYPLPLETPNDGGRSVQIDVHDTSASPFGWHDTNGAAGAEFSDTRGNNVNAQEDADANNTGGVRPSGGSGLNFNFSVNLGQAPSFYQPAVTTNLFYWNNIIHDVLWHYGFDEPAGNFQENNYGNGGAGSDPVEADSQDGSGTNNANFSTPPDGTNPRMQMYIWTAASPDRDSSLDSGIIIHEYAHGVSNRLTGGASNSSALSANQSRGMGEGWGDWLALAFTHQAGDTATTGRGIGTYVKNQSSTGSGIRPYRYTTNMGVNPQTFGDLAKGELSVPHGIGSVWCTTLWEVYWALVGVHGYDSDLINGTSGNNIAIQLVLDGMKLQPVTPTYTEARDAIILADQVNNGGANYTLLWTAFAKRGLGANAYDGGSPSSLSVVESFDFPDDLKVTPSENLFRPGGSPGGPFVPSSRIYTLENTGTSPLNWTASDDVSWLNVSPTSGSLAAGATTTVLANLNGNANSLPGGIHSASVSFLNASSGSTIVRNVELSINDLGAAVDEPSLTFTTSAPDWFTQNAVTFDGVDAAQAGALTHNQSSAMELSVTGPDELRFYWKVDSEGSYDYLRFYDNGVIMSSISGDVDWTQVTYSIPSGTHTLRWQYSKDGSVDNGADTGWLDNLFLASAHPEPAITSDLTANGAVGGSFQYQIVATKNPTSYSSGSLPSGLFLNTATGLISGTPTAQGVYPVNITATNALGSGTKALSIRISGTASFPFTETFESGVLDSVWSVGGTGPNRVQVTQNNTPSTGSWHLTMDSATNQSYARNELTLTIDLAGQSNVALQFEAKDFNDEGNGPPTAPFVGGANFDGIAISADGINWYEVQGLRDEILSNYTHFNIDLDAAISARGLAYNSAFSIRFNQYDNYGITTDGFAFDNIQVISAAPEITVEQPVGTTLVSGVSQVSFGDTGTGQQNTKAFTIRNVGTQPLTDLAGSFTGSAAADFSAAAFGSTTLAPGQATTVNVTLTPSSLGTRSATLRIASNDPDENPFEIALTGVGITPGSVAAGFPFEETFESGALGAFWIVSGTAQHRTLTTQASGPFAGGWHLTMDSAVNGTFSRNELTLLINLSGQSNAALQFWAKEFSDEADGPPPVPFVGHADFDGVAISSDGTNWYEVQPLRSEISGFYGQYTVDLAAAAAAHGLPLNSSFRIRFNHYDNSSITSDGFAFDNIRVVPLEPEITIEQPVGSVLTDAGDTVDFGPVGAGAQSSRSFLIRNDGSQPLAGLVASFSGSASSEYSAGAFGLTTLNPGESTTVAVTFSPSLVGNRATTLHIASNDGNENPFDIGLTGLGTGGITATFPFTETFETGTLDSWWQVSGTGPHRTQITTANTPHAGSRHLTMDSTTDVTYARNELTLTIDLAGQNGIYLGFWAKEFGDEANGPPSAPFTGGADFDGVAISEDGVNWYEVQPLRAEIFSAYTQYGVDLDAAAAARGLSYNSTFRIRFNHYDNYEITTDGFAFDDISVYREVPEIEVEQPAGTSLSDGSSVINFSEVSVGLQTTKAFTVRNSGDAPLTSLAASFSGAAASDYSASSFGSTTLAPGQATTFTVTFAPSVSGARAANLQIANNDSDENPFDIGLNGTGGNPEIAVEQPASSGLSDGGSTIDFGTLTPPQSATKTFTIRNLGTTNLSGLSASVDGVHAADFTFGAFGSSILTPGQNTTFDVHFSPNGGGNRTAALHLASNDADEDPFDVDLTGFGLDQEIVVEEPVDTGLDSGISLRDFGSVSPGQTADLTFTVRNTGNLDLSGLAVSFAGLNQGDFGASTLGAPTLTAGGTTTFTVTFSPQQLGSRSATLRIASNDRDENPFEVSLSGVGVTPEIAVDLLAEEGFIPSLLYGTNSHSLYTINPSTGEVTFVGNTGSQVSGLAYDEGSDTLFGIVTLSDSLIAVSRDTAALSIIGSLGYNGYSAGLAFDPGNNVLYAISQASGSLYSINPATGASTLVGTGGPSSTTSLAYDPNANKLYGVDSNSTGNLYEINTTSGQSTLIGPLGVATSLEGMAFDATNDILYVNDYSSDVLYTINVSTGAATAVGAAAGGTNMLGLAFVPGMGNPTVELSDSADTVDFGEVYVSAQSSQTLQIRNMGTATLNGLSASFTGTAVADYSAGSFGAVSLAPGESTTVEIVFTPTAAGMRPASLEISSNDADENPFDIGLTGEGSDPDIGIEQPVGTELTDGSSTIDFGSKDLGQSEQLTFTITNHGTTNLTDLAASIAGAHSGDYTVGSLSTTTLAPAQSATLDVTFSPTSRGARLAVLHVMSNDLDENPFDVNLTGTGLGPEIEVEEPALTGLESGVSLRSFGSVNIGQSGELTFTVRNSGDQDLSGLAVSFGGVNPGDFSAAAPGQTTLSSGGSTTFTVSFAPQQFGNRNATLLIASNDYDEDPFEVSLSGVGVGPEIKLELIAGGGSPSLLYGTGSNSLYSIDPATGTATLIGGTGVYIYGLAYNANNDKLYGLLALNDTLVTVNQTTAAVTTVGALGYDTASAGLAYDPVANLLYASDRGKLYRINPATAASTLIGAGLPTLTRGLAYDPNADILYGVESQNLYRINTSTSQSTLIGPTGVTTSLEGMAYDSINDILYLNDFEADVLYTVNVNTGAATAVGPAAGGTNMQGLAVVPGVAPDNDELSDAADTVEFGDVSVGATSSRNLKVTNLGNLTLTALAASFTGATASDYSAGPFGAVTLVPGASTNITITFAPTAGEARLASLQIASNDFDENPFDIALSGVGLTPEITVEQPVGTNLTDGGTTLDYNLVSLGGVSGRTFTVRNDGGEPLAGLAASFSGPSASQFSAGSFGSTTLNPGESTTFTVGFAPTTVGAHTATLHIANNDITENPFDITLNGVGVNPEIVVEQPVNVDLTDGATIDYDSVFHTDTEDRTFTIRNTGVSDLTGLTATISGANAGDYSVGALSPNTLSPGQSTTVVITFDGIEEGIRTATLWIASNDADENPFDISLTAESVGPTTLDDFADSFGLTGDERLHSADTDSDSATLLEEYAFGLDTMLPDTVMEPGGSSGLPLIRLVGDRLEIEFVRRRNDSALSYIPEFGSEISTDLPDGFAPATETETVTPINGRFERVIVRDSVGLPINDSRFARVRVTSSSIP